MGPRPSAPGLQRHDAPGSAAPPGALRRGIIHAGALSSGFVVMAAEMVGSRYLTPTFGASIETWAALIATVLLALAVGNFAGGRLADRYPLPQVLGALLMGAAAWLALVPLTADALLATVFAAVEDVRTGSLLGALGLLFVPMALLGAYAPYGIRLTLSATVRSGSVSGQVYALSTVGGILGTLVTPLYLLPWLGTRSITYVLAAVTLLTAALLLALPRRTRRGPPWHATGLLLALSVSVALSAAPRASLAAPEPSFSPAELLARPDGVLEVRETPLTRIYIRKEQRFLVMDFHSSGRHYAESVFDLADPTALVSPYTRVMTVAMVYVTAPRRLLMLGLGGGTTSRYLQRHVPGLQVQEVELDAGVVALARRYFGVRESPDYRIAVSDARVYLMRNTQRYDLLFVDAYRSDTIPFHLLTREFFRLARERLEADGALAINLVIGNRLFESVLKTLRAEFESVETYEIAGQAVAIARLSPALSAAERARRAEAVQLRYGFRHDLRALVKLRHDFAVDPTAPLLSDDFAPVNALRSIDRHNRPPSH
jgi:spermidine synthase